MKRIFLLVGALFLLSSCTTELDQQTYGLRADQTTPYAFFEASTEGTTAPATKVYADENMKVLWNADDRISIFNKTTFNYQYVFTGDDGDTAGGFDLIPASNDFITGQEVDYVYAAYPYSKNNKLNNSGMFSVVLPKYQLYKEHSFGIGANTMVAITDGSFLAFKNVGGFLSLQLYGDGISVTEISIRGNNGEKISGKACVDIPFGGTPSVTMDASATNEISILCDPPVRISDRADNYTEFWFVIPPITFEKGFTIKVTDDQGGVFEKETSKSFTVSRNTLDWMNPLKVIPIYQDPLGDFVPFEDEAFKAFCIELYDLDYDGELSFAEAGLIEDLGVNFAIFDESTQMWFQKYNSLKGIEYFSNLRSLSIDGPGGDDEMAGFLAPLDLSHNKALASLTCVGVRLEELNVSGCTKLTYLNCYDNNLSELDISDCIALTYLDCSFNRLTTLDVQNNTNLKSLGCSSNQLTALNVSHNERLTSLGCSDNQLIHLDVTHCPLLAHLFCDGNNLLSLDVSENTLMEELLCDSNKLEILELGNNPVLTRLTCTCNLLSTLDISSCVSLPALYCSDNHLTSLNLGNNTVISYLDCSNNQLTSLDLNQNTGIKSLSCHKNQLISLSVRGCTGLATLNCMSNQLTDLDVSTLASLTSLECRGNQLASLNVNGCTALNTLNCLTNRLTSLDVSTNLSLYSLNCVFNPYLTAIWLKSGQTISSFMYDTSVAYIYYRD